MDKMSHEDYLRFRMRANDLAEKMIESMDDNAPNNEILCAALTIIVFTISTSATSKDNAYKAMAALFDIGDKMIQEADKMGGTNWSGYKDKH